MKFPMETNLDIYPSSSVLTVHSGPAGCEFATSYSPLLWETEERILGQRRCRLGVAVHRLDFSSNPNPGKGHWSTSKTCTQNVATALRQPATDCGDPRQIVATPNGVWRPETVCGNPKRIVATRHRLANRSALWRPEKDCGDLERIVATRNGLWRPEMHCGDPRRILAT